MHWRIISPEASTLNLVEYKMKESRDFAKDPCKGKEELNHQLREIQGESDKRIKSSVRVSKYLTNEEEIDSLPEKEFRIMIVKMIQNLGKRIDKMQETFNKECFPHRKRRLL